MNSEQNFSSDFHPQQGAQRSKRQIPSFAELLLTCAIKGDVPRYQLPQNTGQCYPSPPHLETHMSERSNLVYASPVSPMQKTSVESRLPYQQAESRDFQAIPSREFQRHPQTPNGVLQNIGNGVPQNLTNGVPQNIDNGVPHGGVQTALPQMAACAPPNVAPSRVAPSRVAPSHVAPSHVVHTNAAPSKLAPAFGHRRSQSLPARPEVELEQKMTSLIDYEKQLVEQRAKLSPEMRQRLVDYHRYAAKMFQENTAAHKIAPERAKCKKSNSSSSSMLQKVAAKDEDHGSLSFTVKPIQPKNYDVETPYLGRHYLNKELSVKNNTLCSQCGSTKTPEWRSGPQGCRTLCNACGLFFTKLTKRMGAEAAGELLAERKKVGTPLDRRICIG